MGSSLCSYFLALCACTKHLLSFPSWHASTVWQPACVENKKQAMGSLRSPTWYFKQLKLLKKSNHYKQGQKLMKKICKWEFTLCLSKTCTFLCMWAISTHCSFTTQQSEDSFAVRTFNTTLFFSSKHSNFAKGLERNWKLIGQTALFHNSLQKEFSLFLDAWKECGYVKKKISDNA